jgi:tight adherence protein B
LALADIDLDAGSFALRVIVASVLLGIVSLLISPVLALVLMVLPYICARSWVSYKGAKRQEKFAEQLPDFLRSIIMSLRSGFGLMQSLETAIEEAQDPIKSEVARVLAEIRMGRDLPEAMAALSQRMDNDDLEWVVGAIDINRETGGNLSEILHTVNTTIRDRQRIRRKVRTLTAEGRLSARILTILPPIIALWQWRAHPEGFDKLLHGPGLIVLFSCAGLMFVGWLWIKRIVAIKV